MRLRRSVRTRTVATLADLCFLNACFAVARVWHAKAPPKGHELSHGKSSRHTPDRQCLPGTLHKGHLPFLLLPQSFISLTQYVLLQSCLQSLLGLASHMPHLSSFAFPPTLPEQSFGGGGGGLLQLAAACTTNASYM